VLTLSTKGSSTSADSFNH